MTRTADHSPRLAEGQHVTLSAATWKDAVAARILGFAGPRVVLLPVDGVRPASKRHSPHAGAGGYLSVPHRGGLLALRGEVAGLAGEEGVVFRITDPFRLGQRRLHSRAPLRLPVRVAPMHRGGAPAGEPWASLTFDLSASGARLARLEAHVPAHRYDLAIGEPGGEAIRLRAELVRETPRDLGLRFVEPDEAVRSRVTDMVIARQRELAALVDAQRRLANDPF